MSKSRQFTGDIVVPVIVRVSADSVEAWNHVINELCGREVPHKDVAGAGKVGGYSYKTIGVANAAKFKKGNRK